MDIMLVALQGLFFSEALKKEIKKRAEENLPTKLQILSARVYLF